MKKIVIIVLTGHFLFLMVLCYTSTVPDLIVPKRFAVKTISLKSEREIAAVDVAVEEPSHQEAHSEPIAKKEEPIAKKEEPIAKKATTKKEVPKVVAKKAVEKAKAKTSEVISSSKSQAIAKAKKALSGLGKISAPSEGAKIGALSIEGLEGDGYISEVVAKLQRGLKLPEFGEVTVELTLEKSGKVLNCLIKDAKSLTNKMYVEKTLPSIKFPMFEGSLKHENAHTFIFVLNSVMD